MNDTNNRQNNDTDDDKPISFLQLLSSVFSALIGIQSEKNRERDFKKMRPIHVLAGGILLMILFFSIVITITRLILANAT